MRIRGATDARRDACSEISRPRSRQEEAMSPIDVRTRRDVMDSTVEDVMHRGVLVCERDAPLSFVAELMATHRVHPVGVVSTLDIAAALSEPDGVLRDNPYPDRAGHGWQV